MSIALITGGNRGLGFATARLLAEQGHRVLITARSLPVAESAAAGLRAEGGSVTGLGLDVTSADSIEAAVLSVRRLAGGLDILVNNAGILPEVTDVEPHEFASVPLFRSTFETILFGPVAVTEAFLPLLRAGTAGRIVNVSSTMGSLSDQFNPDSPYYSTVMPAYQSSKAALNSVSIALSKKLAGTDITVLSVCPGFVRTELTPISKDAPLTPDEAPGSSWAPRPGRYRPGQVPSSTRTASYPGSAYPVTTS